MQKYTIVKFIEPFRDGYEFPMTSWPLHITLADDFELDYKNSKLDDHLNRLLDRQKTVDVVALHDGYLGKYAQTLVTLVDTNVDLTELHKELVAVLKRCGAIFYDPHYIIGGYKPHVTVQKNSRLNYGDVIKIDELSIVDMKPNGNRDRRKVVKTIGFKKPTTGR